MREVNRETLMHLADEAVEQAQYLFMRDGYLVPVALAIGPRGIVPACFGDGASKEAQAQAIKAMAAESQAVIFITDAIVAESDDPEVTSIDSAPKETRMDAILALVYTKAGTTVRRLLYKMNEEAKRPNFADMGWEEDYKVDPGSTFANPYGEVPNERASVR